MNRPEDVVIVLAEDDPGHARLIEKNLRETIANSIVKFANGKDALDYLRREEQARFHTRSGLLTAVSNGGEIELNFPAKTAEPAVAPPGLLEALQVRAQYVGKSKFDYLVQVDGEAV